MQARGVWKLRVTYDARHDCLAVGFEGSALSTVEDVERLVTESVARARTFARPLDMIVTFDGVVIAPAVRHLFTGARLKIGDRLAGRFYRVASTPAARDLFGPSMVGFSSAIVLYPDYASAAEAMLADRVSSSPSSPSPAARAT